MASGITSRPIRGGSAPMLVLLTLSIQFLASPGAGAGVGERPRTSARSIEALWAMLDHSNRRESVRPPAPCGQWPALTLTTWADANGMSGFVRPIGTLEGDLPPPARAS